jgi:hypothetical protein
MNWVGATSRAEGPLPFIPVHNIRLGQELSKKESVWRLVGSRDAELQDCNVAFILDCLDKDRICILDNSYELQ